MQEKKESPEKPFSINGNEVKAGENKVINLNIARLISGTPIDLPIYVYRSKKAGPVVLLSGGLHGDEVDGIEIVRRLIQSKTFNKLKQGSVIAIPVMNIYGFLNYSREVPDGKDINRSFPGSKNGSLAARIAHHLKENVLSEIDFGIDFHTGGANRYNFPQCRYYERDKQAEKIAEVFNAPIALSSNLIDKSLRKEALKMGKSIVVYEGGEAMRYDPEAISEGIKGARKVLHHYGMIQSEESSNPSIHCSNSHWVRAKSSGLLQVLTHSGERIKRRQLMARITDPFGNFETKIKAKQDAVIIGHNNAPLVNKGDALFHLGEY